MQTQVRSEEKGNPILVDPFVLENESIHWTKKAGLTAIAKFKDYQPEGK